MTEPDDLDPRAAAELIQQATRTARRSLTFRAPVVYASWGVAWLAGLGAMWLSVRGQTHYRGPSAGPAILFGVLIVLAIAATMVSVLQASRGISGQTEAQGRIFGFSWLIGFAAWFAINAALSMAGASEDILGVASTAGPLLVTSLLYLAGAGIWLDWPMFVMGLWLALVTAVAVFTGPVGVLLVAAAAGGGGFLMMAGYLSWRGHREPA